MVFFLLSPTPLASMECNISHGIALDTRIMFFLLSPTPWLAGECKLSLVVCFGAPKLQLEYASLFGCNIGLDFHLGSTRKRGLNVGRCFIDATCTKVQKKKKELCGYILFYYSKASTM